jgi:hypothetical protein
MAAPCEEGEEVCADGSAGAEGAREAHPAADLRSSLDAVLTPWVAGEVAALHAQVASTCRRLEVCPFI